MTSTENGCPRCGDAPPRLSLRPWGELSDEEREVVHRLPASAGLSIEERAARHLWCVRCWHEETGGERREA